MRVGARLGLCVQHLPKPAPARVLACGAWLKNTACLLDGEAVWWSPLHGDLGDPASRSALLNSVAALQDRAQGPIEAVAHDLHPDFYSTQVAQALAQRLGVPAIAVQHHHAHLAVVQAETSQVGPLVGLALDGVGWGTDGTAWGGEVLLLRGAQCQRLAHLPALLLPGGDVAAREPWRMAAAVLHRLGRAHEIEARLGGQCGVSAAVAKQLPAMMRRGLNCPITTSAGRWFDAVAGLLGVCAVQTEEAQAAQALQRLAAGWLATHPGCQLNPTLRGVGLDLDKLMLHLLALLPTSRLADGCAPERQAEGAALFHLALAQALADAALQAARAARQTTVVLSGGCFFNHLLRQLVSEHLQNAGVQGVLPKDLNCGDAGLALGQAWVAALAMQAAAAHHDLSRSAVCA